MNTTFMPSLQHLSSCRIIASLLNHLGAVENIRHVGTWATKLEVQGAIAHLTTSTPLQNYLKQFIEPLLHVIENCLEKFEFSWLGYSLADKVVEIIPFCWCSDGTIDRQKVARALVKNETLKVLDRFLLACTFSIFDEALAIWNTLEKIEKAHLGHNSIEIAKPWAEWLESSSAKNWQSFREWSLGSPLCHNNVYMLKHALQMISPAERSQYLLKAASENKVQNSLMRFCLQGMTKEDQVQLFKKSPVKVFRCIVSWPLQAIFFDLLNDLWPYLTADSFCLVLGMIFKKIRKRRANLELLNIVKKLWSICPSDFKEEVIAQPTLFNPLQFVLDFDMLQEFPHEDFSKIFQKAFEMLELEMQMELRELEAQMALQDMEVQMELEEMEAQIEIHNRRERSLPLMPYREVANARVKGWI